MLGSAIDALPARDIRIDAGSAARAGDYDVVRRALAHISSRFQDQPSVPDVARAVGVTPVQLTRSSTAGPG